MQRSQFNMDGQSPTSDGMNHPVQSPGILPPVTFSPPLTTNGYDGFNQVQTPEQYLDAPSTINSPVPQHANLSTAGVYNMNDIATGSYFDLSPMVNVHDPVNMHFLVQTTIADSKGYKVLSYQELTAAKKEAASLHSRINDLSHKLNMEYKLKDAASSLSKLNGDERRSKLFSSGNKKRLSRQAEEEVDVASKKIQTMETEIAQLTQRVTELDTKILKHNVGVLALTHQTSGSSSARIYEEHTNSLKKSDSIKENGGGIASVPASQRMMRHSRVVSQTGSGGSSGGGGNSQEVEELVVSVAGALDLDSAPADKSMNNLTNLVNTLIDKYHRVRSQSRTKEQQSDEYRRILVDAVLHVSPDTQALSQDPQQLRRQVFDAIRSYSGDGEGGASKTDETSKVKALLQQQLDSVMSAYEQNRVELEKYELENVDLKTSLRDAKFEAQAKTQDLENQLKANDERVQEWKERCDTLKSELESVVMSLEDLTRQTVEYESDRQTLEKRVSELQTQLEQGQRDNLDKRASMMAPPPQTPATPKSDYDEDEHHHHNQHSAHQVSRSVAPTRAAKVVTTDPNIEPTSVTLLRHEFKRIIMDMNSKHTDQLKKEQMERNRLESLLRSIKTSSYVANLPPGKLESLGVL